MEDYKKKYEQLLKFINDLYPHMSDYCKEKTEGFIPELKESEDERIRKTLIQYLKDYPNLPNGNYCRDDFFAWLEKQGEKTNPYSGISFEYNGHIWGMCARDNGVDILLDKQLFKHLENQGEQKTVSKTEPIIEGLATEFQKQVSHLIASAMDKEHEYTKGYVEWVAQSLLGYAKNEQTPADKVEPKFKVGDWVRAISSSNIFKILSVNDGLYRVLCYDGVEANYPIIDVEKDLAYWTIQDAKEGDVLVDNLPFIFKKIDANKYSYAYCGISLDYGFRVESEGEFGEWTWAQDIKPATKEQRDLLFQKMKEAGYEWDVEKKELRKIEQNPAWSEEDEQMVQKTINGLYDCSMLHKQSKREIESWLKSLKERVQSKPKQEWSEEDDKYFNVIYKELESYIAIKGYYTPLSCADLNWLKSLKERMKGE